METIANLCEIEVVSPQQNIVTSGDLKLGVHPQVIISKGELSSGVKSLRDYPKEPIQISNLEHLILITLSSYPLQSFDSWKINPCIPRKLWNRSKIRSWNYVIKLIKVLNHIWLRNFFCHELLQECWALFVKIVHFWC